MDVSTDWNVCDYKTTHECDEHWKLRKEFMERHKSRIPEDELVGLAQVFTNIEILGCSYPAETMQKVAHLSKDVAKDFRKSRENKLKRSFVSASDAAASKVQRHATNKSFNSNESSEKKEVKFTPQRVPTIDDLWDKIIVLNQNAQQTQTEFEKSNLGKFTETITDDGKGYFTAKIFVNSFLLVECTVYGKTAAKKLSKKKMLEKLNKHCFKINKTMAHSLQNENIKRKELIGTQRLLSYKETSLNAEKVQSDNKGFQMLQKLGWGGGALGSNKDGIVDPIAMQIKIGRCGLGGKPQETTTTDSNQSKKQKIDVQKQKYGIDVNYYRRVLQEFKESGIEYDLVFSHEFTKEERALFHSISQSLGLKTQSYGEGVDRKFVVKGRKLLPQEIMQKLLDYDPAFSKIYKLEGPDETVTLSNNSETA